MRPWLAFTTLATAALAVGCADDLPSTSLVDKLRVIAIRAEPPEGMPGTSVHLDPLVVDPKQALRELEHAWFVCVPSPGEAAQSCLDDNFASGASPRLCIVDPEARVCLASVDPTADYVLPQLALAGRPEGEAGQIIITHAVAQKGLLGPCAEHFRDEGIPAEECHISVKRLVVSRQAAANKNPTLGSIMLDEQPLDAVTLGPEVDTESKHMLRVELPADAEETLPMPAFDGTTKEQLFLSWYSTAGAIETARTEPTVLMNEWLAPERPVPVKMFVVVHDGRGGVAWTQGQVRVRLAP